MGKVVGLTELLYSQNFSIAGLIFQEPENPIKEPDHYRVTGVADEKTLSRGDYNRRLERADILSVTVRVPDSYIEPVALWIGDQFAAEAEKKGAAHLPIVGVWQ